MTQASLPKTLQAGTNENINDVSDNLVALRDTMNGNLDGGNLTQATAERLGLTTTDGPAPAVRSGVTIIPGAESRSSASYGLLTTADQVQNIVVPTGATLHIMYSAVWQESVVNAARAAIFIGSNQLKSGPPAGTGSAVPVVQETEHNAALATQNQPLFTTAGGLRGYDRTGGWSWVTTGVVNGLGAGSAYAAPAAGWCEVERLAAGTYTVSVQFKASSGSVTVSDRVLKVKVEAF